MQTSEKSPFDLEALEQFSAEAMEAAAPYPAQHAPGGKLTRPKYIPYLIFALCASLYFMPFMRLVRQLGGDEGSFLDGAARIIRGQVFARDFFEVVGPGSFYYLALFLRLFGVTFMATRVCLFLSSLGTALLIYYLSRRLCRRYQVLPCILLFAAYFGGFWPTISHHVDSNFFALLAFTCVVLWQDSHKRYLLVAAGALAGITACFMQPKGILLVLAFIAWLWIERRQRLASPAALSLVAGSYLSLGGIVLVYFWSKGALADLVYVNAVWPFQHYSAINVVSYAQGTRDYWDMWAIAKPGFQWTFGTAAVLITPILFFAVLPALLPLLSVPYLRKTLSSQVTLYWLCGWALWLSEIHRKDIGHIVFGSPLLMILCIYYLEQYRAKTAELCLQVLAISAGCLAAFNLFLVLSAHPMPTRVGPVATFKSEPVLALLEKKAGPGDEIFAYPYIPMYYFLSATINPTRYSGILYNFNTSSQFDEVVRVLEQRRVRYVVWNTGFRESAMKRVFPAVQKMPDDKLIIEPYLESHYKVLWANSHTRLMERKDQDHAN
jgi:Dolichyl-phosphate-mannose-protein mannosyltransferase